MIKFETMVKSKVLLETVTDEETLIENLNPTISNLQMKIS